MIFIRKFLSEALKYDKTPAQVILRFLIEQGIAVIPKTSKKARMVENLNIFDFSLSTKDKEILSSLDTNKSSLRVSLDNLAFCICNNDKRMLW